MGRTALKAPDPPGRVTPFRILGVCGTEHGPSSILLGAPRGPGGLGAQPEFGGPQMCPPPQGHENREKAHEENMAETCIPYLEDKMSAGSMGEPY